MGSTVGGCLAGSRFEAVGPVRAYAAFDKIELFVHEGQGAEGRGQGAGGHGPAEAGA